MRMNGNWTWILLLAISAVWGCGGGEPAGSGTTSTEGGEEVSNLEGEIVIDGSSTVQPLTTTAAESFIKIHEKVRIPVSTSGTGGGFKKFVKGETDISNASRPITAEEFAQCKQNGVEFIEIPIAYDGLTIVVNPANDWCNELTVEQIGKIYLDNNPAMTWQDVDPAWPAEPLKIYSPGTDSGTFDYFREVLGGKSVAIRDDMQTSEDDNVIVKGVESDKGAIGYFGAAYYQEEGGKLKAVKIINPKTGEPVAASLETVVSGDYSPYSRPLFVYVNLASIERPEVQLFVEHYVENAGKFAGEVGYFPLPDSIYSLVGEHLTGLKAGTCFVDAEGKTREGPFLELFNSANLVSTK